MGGRANVFQHHFSSIDASGTTPLPRHAIEDRLDHMQRRQGEPQQAVDEGACEALGFRDFTRRPVSSILQQSLPPMRPHQRTDQRLVRPRFCRRPGIAANDHLAAGPGHEDDAR